MKMNAYMMMPDYKKVEETFDELLSLRLNKKQNLDVSVKAFYYYLDEEKEGNVKNCLSVSNRWVKMQFMKNVR